MYGSVLARTSAPWSTAVGGIPCVTSITRASGAMRAMTPWHVPTKSSWRPKSREEADDHRRRVYASAASADLDRGDDAVEVAASRPPRAR